MRVYIAIPRRGNRDVRAVAAEAERRLTAAGHDPVFVGLEEIDIVNIPSMELWVNDMRTRLASLVTCDGVCLMPGWTRDSGTVLEYHVGRNLKFVCQGIDSWTVEPLTWQMLQMDLKPHLPTDRLPTPREWRDWFVRLSFEEQIDIAAKVQQVNALLVQYLTQQKED